GSQRGEARVVKLILCCPVHGSLLILIAQREDDLPGRCFVVRLVEIELVAAGHAQGDVDCPAERPLVPGLQQLIEVASADRGQISAHDLDGAPGDGSIVRADPHGSGPHWVRVLSYDLSPLAGLAPETGPD